jgi:predicted MPP superfamily phosphohydrolase
LKIVNIFLRALLLVLIFFAAMGIYVWRIEPRWVEYNYFDMPIKNLPDSLQNKTLIQLSDIHIGETVNEDFIIKKFKEVNKLNPDIVVYTGDFISIVRKNEAPFDQLEEALKHAAKGKLATIAILGNHDYGILARNGSRADSLVTILESYGITVLRNDSLNVQGLNIIGIDDYWGRNFRPKKAMNSYHQNATNLILVHNPDVCDLDIWRGYDGWILSGHTHGGQFRLPFRKPPIIPVENKNYDSGLKHLADGRTLYINKGLGHSIRVRFNVRPEIAVFTLKRKG